MKNVFGLVSRYRSTLYFANFCSKSAVGGVWAFNAFTQLQRAGLGKDARHVYVGFASHCDFYNYSGWEVAYSRGGLQEVRRGAQ